MMGPMVANERRGSMRTSLMVVLLALLVVCVGGCMGVSKEDQARIDDTVRRQKELTKEMFDAGMALIEELRTIETKGKDGSLTVGEVESAIRFAERKAEMVIESLKQERETFRDEEKYLRDQGYSGMQILAAFLGSAVFGAGGGAVLTQKIRGSIYNRNGDIGARTPPA